MIDRYTKKCDKIGVQGEGLRGEKGAVALAARLDTMRAPVRKMKKCPMYIVLSRFNKFLFV